MEAKTLHHICIQTNAYNESLNFYKNILGFEIVKETENFHGRHYNTWLKLNNFMIELQTAKAGEVFDSFNKNNEGIVHFCFYVDNLQNEYIRLKQLGISQFISKNGNDIYEVEGGKLLKLAAPEGTIIEFRDKADI